MPNPAREDGDDPFNLINFQQEIRSEYLSLTEVEKADYVTAYQDRKADLLKTRRPSAKSRVTDMAKTLDTIESMVRIFFCNTTIANLTFTHSSRPSKFASGWKVSSALFVPTRSFISSLAFTGRTPSLSRSLLYLPLSAEAGTLPPSEPRSRPLQSLGVMLQVRISDSFTLTSHSDHSLVLQL
jgi:hypothetical protein